MGRELTPADSSLSAGNIESFVLYSAALSPCVRRCRITMIEKGLDFDTVDVDLANMQQRSPGYLALNPNGFVPTLCHRDRVIYESGVINEYLEEQFPEIPLFPSDPFQKAKVRMWMAAEGFMAKIFRAVMYQRLMGPIHHLSRTHEEAQIIAGRATTDPQDLAWESRVWKLAVLSPGEEAEDEAKLLSWLAMVEAALEGNDYLVGNQFSQADISMYPRIFMYAEAGIAIEASGYPNVMAWMSRLETRPSFRASLTPQAIKLRRMATSPLLGKVRAVLSRPASSRGYLDRATLFVVGKFMRRVLGVNRLLNDASPVQPIVKVSPAGPGVETRPFQKCVTTAFSGQLTLHGDHRCPYTMRIRLLLDALGQGYRFIDVDSIGPSHPTRKYLALNPLGEVLTLEHGDRVVSGSSTIAEYLGDIFDRDGLWFADDSVQASEQRMWLALESGSHKEFKPLWMRYVAGGADDHGFVAGEESAIQHIATALGRIEGALQSQSYLGGEQPKFADLAWRTRLDMLQQVPRFSLDNCPSIQRWLITLVTEKMSPHTHGIQGEAR